MTKEKMIKELSEKSGLSEKEIGKKANNMANKVAGEKPNFGTAPLPDDDW
jgi:nucleoid DNA-binding protein